jgi:hypothetical protein
LDTELNANNNIQATGSLALPVLKHSFGITGTKKSCKNWTGNKVTANYIWQKQTVCETQKG